MSKHLSELCALLVDETYGSLAHGIFSILAAYGRLSMWSLRSHSRISSRQLKNGLALLIHQGLVLYSAPEHDATMYEVNLRRAYDLVRFGKNVVLATERLGEGINGILSDLQALGYARPSEFTASGFTNSAPAEVRGSPNAGHVSSPSKRTEVDTSSKYSEEALKDSHCLEPVRFTDFLPAFEFDNEVKSIVRREEHDDMVIKGIKMTAEFNRNVLKRKNHWKDDDVATIVVGVGSSGRLKRGKDDKLKNEPRIVKKRKLNASHEYCVNDRRNGEAAADRTAKDNEECEPVVSRIGNIWVPTSHLLIVDKGKSNNVPVRLCRDKHIVFLRSQLLVALASRYLGATASKVYAALLRALERHIARCHDEYLDIHGGKDDPWANHLPSVTSSDVLNEFESLDELDPVTLTTTASSKVKSEHDGANGHWRREDSGAVTVNGHQHEGDGALARDEIERTTVINQNLDLLANHSYTFAESTVVREHRQSVVYWTINFPDVTRLLVQQELEKLVTARFGSLAAQIIRTLHDKGKLDEKQITFETLRHQKEIRAVLTTLQEHGYLDTQEVPRDNTRQPSRTIYLWNFDQDRCRRRVLQDTYKGMARLLQRIKVEREKIRAVIDKAERTDVRGHEAEYLSNAEKVAMENWLEREEKLLVQLFRQDDLVAVLRDFLPTPPW